MDRSGEKRVKKERVQGNCYPVSRISTIIIFLLQSHKKFHNVIPRTLYRNRLRRHVLLKPQDLFGLFPNS